MACQDGVYKYDSNNTGLYIAEEECVGVVADNAIFEQAEPNSYSDFGGKTTNKARSMLNPGRKQRKGSPVDVEASGGFNQDFTQNNTTRRLQEFFFADVRERGASHPYNGAQNNVTAVVAADKSYAVAGGFSAGTKAGTLMWASGFEKSANNGLKHIASVSASKITVTETLVDNPAVGTTARLAEVGFEFEAGVVGLKVEGGATYLEVNASKTFDFTTLKLLPGEWIFVGGDASLTNFGAGNTGYARVSKIEAGKLYFDLAYFEAPASNVGTTSTLQIFYGLLIRDESDPELIKRRTVTMLRSISGKESTKDRVAELLTGSAGNELTLNLAQADFVTCDLGYISSRHVVLDESVDSGAFKSWQFNNLPVDDAYNTSSDIGVLRMFEVKGVNQNPAPLFAYATDAKITINNGITPNKAIGVMGAFDTSAGNFKVSGSVTAYYNNADSLRLASSNVDIGMVLMAAKNKSGWLFDLPTVSVGSGSAQVELDNAIKIPLDSEAAESKFGHTLLHVKFKYLPQAAMFQ